MLYSVFGQILSRKSFRRYASDEVVCRFLFALVGESEWITVTANVVACRDPKDDKFLSLALSGNATHIITGDSDLLALHPFRGIEILSPRSFLEAQYPSQ